MKDLVTYIVTNLTSKPDAVVIEEETLDNALNFKLTVDPEDMGRIIGKSGQTIKAIRNLLVARALAETPSVKVYLNLQESK